MSAGSEYRLFEVDIAGGDIRLIAAESALFADESADMGILVEVVFKWFAAERTESSLGSLKYLVRSESVSLGAEIFHVLVIRIRSAKTSRIRVVAVENEVALKGLAEAVYLLDKSLHFAVAVELVAEEIEHDEGLEFKL